MFWGALRVEEAAEAFGEPRLGGSLPDVPMLVTQRCSGLPAPFGIFQETVTSLSVSLGDSIPDGNALGQELRLSAWGALAWSLRRHPPEPCPSPPCAALNYTCVSPKQSANDHKESRDWLAVVLTCSILLRVFLTPDKLTESCTLTPFLKKRQAAASAFPSVKVCVWIRLDRVFLPAATMREAEGGVLRSP